MNRFRLLAVTALFGLATLPLAAQDRMMRSDCQVAFERLSDLIAPDDKETPRRLEAIRVTPQGWCKISGRGDEIAEFETLEWRADGITRWTRDAIPPLGLQVRIFGLDPDNMQGSDATRRPLVDVDITLRQVPDAGLIVLERAVMSNNAGDSLAVSGVFERVFLSSPSMVQVSMGSATFKAGLLTLTLDGTHENPFGFNTDVEIYGTSGAQSEAAFKAISLLPDGVIDAASRAELTAFAADFPKPVGTIELSVNSARGLGMMQVGMAAAMAVAGPMGADELEILLDGLTITADWTPVAQNAD